jgi:hypothetical protein
MNRTVIDASSNAPGMLRNLNLQSTLQESVTRGIPGLR